MRKVAARLWSAITRKETPCGEAGRYFFPARLSMARENVPEKVGVVVAFHPLDDGGDSFEPHAGIDAGLGEGFQRPVGKAFELHENEVPEFQVPVAVAPEAALGAPAADARSLVDDDLRTRPARAGVAHLPEIILGGEFPDPVFRRQSVSRTRGPPRRARGPGTSLPRESSPRVFPGAAEASRSGIPRQRRWPLP